MFQWSNQKTNKTVSFSQEVTDKTLLRMIEEALATNPHKSFSDLCKEALWNLLGVPESLRPSPKLGEIEQQIAALQNMIVELQQRSLSDSYNAVVTTDGNVDVSRLVEQLSQLQRQFTGFEQRVMGDVNSRLASLERLVYQLEQQYQPPSTTSAPASAAIPTSNQWGTPTQTRPVSRSEAKIESQAANSSPAEENDPLLKRMRNLLDDSF